MNSQVTTLRHARVGAMSAALGDADLLGFQRQGGRARAKAAFVGFTYIVTNTMDTDSQITPTPPADIAGSFRAALDAAILHDGSTVNFNLPMNSTITLLSVTPPFNASAVAGSINIDFTGAPGLTITSATSGTTTQGPYTVLRDYSNFNITGTLKGDANSNTLLRLSAPTATATLNANAGLVGVGGANPTVSDGGATLTLSTGSTVSNTVGNAVNLNQNNGAVTGQSVVIAAGATVSGTSSSSAAFFAGTNATGATISNAGTISSTGQSAYVGNANAALTNTSTGVVTLGSTNNALQLNVSSTLSNSGLVTNTSTGIGLFNSGSGTVTNTGTGTISSTGGAAYVASGASNLVNQSSGLITTASASAAVSLNGSATANNAGSITNTDMAVSATAFVNSGTGTATNSGTISSALGQGYFGSSASNLANLSGGTVTSASASSSVGLSGTATVNNAGTITNTYAGSATSATALFNGGTGLVTNSGTISIADGGAYSGAAGSSLSNVSGGTITTSAAGNVAAVTVSGTGMVTNAGTISSTNTGATNGIGVIATGAGTIVNSGTISFASTTAGYAVGLQSGATLTSTGTISAGATGRSAVSTFGSTGTITVNLNAGSSTTGGVGGTNGANLAITLAGSLSGNITGGSEADTLKLDNSSGFSFSSGSINLGGGGDVLTLDGSATNTLQGTVVTSDVALVKTGSGRWELRQTGTHYTGVTLNAGTLQVDQANSAGSGTITFGAGSQLLALEASSGTTTYTATLNNFGAEDQIDLVNYGTATASVSGNVLTVTRANFGTANITFSAGQLANRAVTVTDDGGGGSLITIAAAPVPVAPTNPATDPNLPSNRAGVPTSFSNLTRSDPNSVADTTPGTSLYTQAQAEANIVAQYNAGKILIQDVQSQLFHLVDGTTSLAEISYAFFTGATPTAAGLNYLVNSTTNPTDLNDPYYQNFNVDNRYINVAVSLGTGQGAGAAAFTAAYGALSLTDAATKAYTAIFGAAPAAGKIDAILNAQVPNGLGGTETRAQYLADVSGGTTIAQKAALVGFFLSDSLREGGTYANADQHFLADLAHGTAAYNVDLLVAYGPPLTTVGTPTPDQTVPH